MIGQPLPRLEGLVNSREASQSRSSSSSPALHRPQTASAELIRTMQIRDRIATNLSEQLERHQSQCINDATRAVVGDHPNAILQKISDADDSEKVILWREAFSKRHQEPQLLDGTLAELIATLGHIRDYSATGRPVPTISANELHQLFAEAAQSLSVTPSSRIKHHAMLQMSTNNIRQYYVNFCGKLPAAKPLRRFSYLSELHELALTFPDPAFARSIKDLVLETLMGSTEACVAEVEDNYSIKTEAEASGRRAQNLVTPYNAPHFLAPAIRIHGSLFQ